MSASWTRWIAPPSPPPPSAGVGAALAPIVRPARCARRCRPVRRASLRVGPAPDLRGGRVRRPAGAGEQSGGSAPLRRGVWSLWSREAGCRARLAALAVGRLGEGLRCAPAPASRPPAHPPAAVRGQVSGKGSRATRRVAARGQESSDGRGPTSNRATASRRERRRGSRPTRPPMIRRVRAGPEGARPASRQASRPQRPTPGERAARDLGPPEATSAGRRPVVPAGPADAQRGRSEDTTRAQRARAGGRRRRPTRGADEGGGSLGGLRKTQPRSPRRRRPWPGGCGGAGGRCRRRGGGSG